MFDVLIEGIETGGQNTKNVTIHVISLVLAGIYIIDTMFNTFKTVVKSVWRRWQG